MKNSTITSILLIVLILAAPGAFAENVDLAALPARNTVQLTIYNSEDITLVKESRFLSFDRGRNTLQFSWANTLIDPTSIELRPLEHADKIEVTATVFPRQKPQHLIWHIDSEYAGQAKVEVSYFTSGLTWQMDYVATTTPDESSMDLKGFVRVVNRSGETYDNAQVRLIVGKINLVEKIADLARQYGMLRPPQESSQKYKELRRRATRESFSKALKMARPGAAPRPPMVNAPKAVVKEGISEYFMFSVMGQEDIPNGWSKRMRALNANGVKFDIVHRLRTYQYGPKPIKFYVWQNDKEHKLGNSPLPDGMVRVFRDNGRDGLAFLAEQKISYVPIKAKAEINLGIDKHVVYERRKMQTRRFNFDFHRPYNRGRWYIRGWDEEQKWIDIVRNYRDKPLNLEVRKMYSGDVDYQSEEGAKTFDYRTVEATLNLKAGAKKEYPYTVTIHQGSTAKQSRVKVKR